MPWWSAEEWWTPLPVFAASLLCYHIVHGIGLSWCGHTQPRVPLYITSALHATIVASASAYLLWRHGVIQPATRAAFDEVGAPAPGAAPSWAGQALATHSFAYFAYDFVASMPDCQ